MLQLILLDRKLLPVRDESVPMSWIEGVARSLVEFLVFHASVCRLRPLMREGVVLQQKNYYEAATKRINKRGRHFTDLRCCDVHAKGS